MNTQVMRLLSGVSVHGDQHLAEVERDLVQMDVLLDEAIKKLCTNFMAIHHAVDRQQEALNGLLAGSMPASEYAARIEALRGEIGQHVGAAVTGLQFQDMTSQLIGRMVQHLAGLRDVFGALDTNAAALPESGNEALLALLGDIGNRVGVRSSGVRSTVNQRHMESGDIELF
ncbi:chemotaxis protein [Thiobacillus sp.]|uniref:chemotaxis protein n=1 Tax=Thiobacillus sp. TaxID=924 RepID=UPI0025DD627A|nr:chemotaxis protein [Thiobacillus sp.]